MLSSDIVAMYIQAATKVFGSWAADVAQRWTDDDLTHLKSMVEFMISRLRELVQSSQIEVQERVRHKHIPHECQLTIPML